jgi:hypothetical protein
VIGSVVAAGIVAVTGLVSVATGRPTVGVSGDVTGGAGLDVTGAVGGAVVGAAAVGAGSEGIGAHAVTAIRKISKTTGRPTAPAKLRDLIPPLL